MKTNFSLVAAFSLALAGVCSAQSTTVRTAEPATVQVQNVEGTLHAVGPDSVVVQGGKDSKALTYRYPQAARYVDESGNVVKRELLVPGLPVTVQYVRDGDSLVAKNVIVHQKVTTATESGPAGTATTTTTSTTTEKVKNTVAEGVLGLWESDRFELNTEKHGTVRFLYSKDTKFVDADSKHVDVIRMKPGLPVTVRFRQEGDHLSADQVTLNARTVEVTR